MNLFFWRKNKAIDMFASNLANELYSTIQPDTAKQYFGSASADKEARKIQKKIDGKIQDIIKQIEHFRAVNSLGVYGKARIHLTFAERLNELGYDANIAKKINEHIMLKTP